MHFTANGCRSISRCVCLCTVVIVTLVIPAVLPITADASTGSCSKELKDAVYYRDFDTVVKLIKAGENPNCHGRRHGLLADAAENGDIEGMKVLLSHGAALNFYGNCYARELKEALGDQQKEAAEFLLEQGAFIEVDHCYDECILLRGAIYVESIPIIKKILSYGIDLKKCPRAIVDAGQRDFSIIRLLLEHGADPKSQDPDGDTVLTEIAWSSDIELVRLLLEGGADPNHADGTSDTALHVAAGNRTGEVGVAALLLEYGANPNSVRAGGLTPLFWAAEKDNVAIVQLLVENGADVNWLNDKKQTVLDYLESRRYSMDSASVQYLKKKGAKFGPYGKEVFTYKFTGSLPQITIGVGIPVNNQPSTDKSFNIDTTLGFRILAIKSERSIYPQYMWKRRGLRFIPEIGYQFKKDTIEGQVRHLRLFRSGLSWTAILNRSHRSPGFPWGIGTDHAFLVGNYSDESVKGIRNGIHFGIWDFLELDVSHVWLKQRDADDIQFIYIGLNMDLLFGVLSLMAMGVPAYQ